MPLGPDSVLLPVASSLLLFALVKALLSLLSTYGAAGISAGAATLAACVLFLVPLRAGHAAAAARLLARGISLLFACFVVAAPVSIPATGFSDLLPGWLFHEARWLALPLALAAWFRPSLGLLLLAHVWASKAVYWEITGLPITRTDWMIVWELGILLVIGMCVCETWRRLLGLDRSARLRAEECLVLACAAIHLSNYFISGYGKVVLGPAPWSWLVENPTDVLIINSWHMGLLPIAVSGELAAGVYRAAHAVPYLVNAATLVPQLLSPLALVRPAWQRGLFAYFELQHITIFLLTGIFFWKWIVLNILLIVALGRLKLFRPGPVAVMLLVVLLLAAPHVFNIVRLAWFDTRLLNDATLVAVTRDGRDIELPTSVALYGSLTFTQSRAGKPFGGAALTDSLGMTLDEKLVRSAGACNDPAFVHAGRWRTPGHGPDIRSLRRVIGPTMAFIAGHPFYREDLARVHFFAHHVFSNPWLYPDVRGVRAADVAAVDLALVVRCTFLDADQQPGSLVLAQERWRILDESDTGAWR